MIKKRLRRVCHRCGEMFVPTGKACHICENCLKKCRKPKGGRK